MRHSARWGWLPAVLLLAALAPAAAVAETRQVALLPGSSSVEIRTYGLGLLPLDGRFARFHGVLRYDAADHARCSVALQVDAASLAMGSEAVTATVLGADFLDAARYPSLAYDGACEPAGLAGALTLHGVTRPFALTTEWRDGEVAAVGRLRRADWGMTAHPLMGGSTVRITVTVRLPAAGAPARAEVK